MTSSHLRFYPGPSHQARFTQDLLARSVFPAQFSHNERSHRDDEKRGRKGESCVSRCCSSRCSWIAGFFELWLLSLQCRVLEGYCTYARLAATPDFPLRKTLVARDPPPLKVRLATLLEPRCSLTDHICARGSTFTSSTSTR